ncbi:MAG: C-GCAxxG-C-C family (seleno)protein [Candidatus Methylomirabilia bacterium]
MNCNETCTRRGFLKNTGLVAAAAGITLAVSGMPKFATAAAAKDGPTEKWPWPYEKLDPAVTAEIAYNEWYRAYCGAAVINSVFSQLRAKIGEPYKSFPVDAFLFLEGGVSGWGTICGSNAGANIVTNAILGPRIAGSETGMLMGSEIMQWYSDAKMPVFLPKEPKIKDELIPKTVAGSPLCHISVGRWMAEADKPLASAERKDRCARVAASVAYRTVELLNAWKDGAYVTTGAIPAMKYKIQAQHNCTDCHGKDVPSPPVAAAAK